MAKIADKEPETRRRFERYLAIPGSRAKFYAHMETRCENTDVEYIQAGSILDICDGGCAFETPGQPSYSAGQAGRVVLLRDDTYTVEIKHAKVSRVWAKGIAADFETDVESDACVRRFFSFPKTSCIMEGPEANRKQRLAENDLRELSGETLRLKGQSTRMFVLWVTATAVVLAAVFSQNPAIRNINLGVCIILAGMLAITFLLWDLQRISLLNQLDGFLILVNQQLNQGTYLSGYSGWHDALVNLQCCSNKFCYNKRKCPEEAWKWARKVKPMARKRSWRVDRSVGMNFIYAAAALCFAGFTCWYIRMSMSYGGLYLLVKVLLVAFFILLGYVGWLVYSVLLGRESIVSHYCQWFMLLSYCSPFNPNLLKLKSHDVHRRMKKP